MLYYALEAVIVGLFIMVVWKLCLSRYLGDVGYLQIIGIYWIFKMLMFDVFKLLSGLTSMGSNMQKEMDENEENDN